MTARWLRLLRWSTPHDVSDDERPRAEVFAIILWLALTLSAVSAALAALSGIWLLAALNVIDAAFAALLLSRYRSGVWADAPRTVRGFLSAFLVPLCLGTLATSPMDLSNLSYLGLLPLVSATMLSAHETRRWFFIVMSAGAVVLVLGHNGVVMPHVDPAPGFTHLMNFVSVLGASMALLQAISNERERSLERVREAERAKSAFLANVGHEIRTPLNGVLGMADALLTHPLAHDDREMVRIIRDSGQNLHALIDDLLDVSKLEAKRLELHPGPVDLRELAHELRGLWTPAAIAKGLRLDVELDERLPPAALLDGVRVRQIINNLTSNAVKFTQTGHVRVRLLERSGRFVCEVHDTGLGIDPESQRRLFQRFMQADASRARTRQGTGLGLALSRQLAELMGGTVTLFSTLGAGSCFTCELPLIATEAPEPAPATTVELGLRVLVVDDNAVNRLVAQRLLDKTGCAVTVASSGQAALQGFEASAFDVVLMDVHMPEMDGLEVARRMRSVSRTLPIIGLSASADRDDVEACRRAGMNDFLAKPLTQARLVEALRQARAA